MSTTTDSIERGTAVRNVKTGTLFFFCSYRYEPDADQICLVESRRDGKRFGRVRYLNRSQIEPVEGNAK